MVLIAKNKNILVTSLQFFILTVTSSIALAGIIKGIFFYALCTVSADMAHGVHPNFMDKHEEHHRPELQKGLVIKHNANQRYATSGITAFLFKEVGRIHNLPTQVISIWHDVLGKKEKIITCLFFFAFTSYVFSFTSTGRSFVWQELKNSWRLVVVCSLMTLCFSMSSL